MAADESDRFVNITDSDFIHFFSQFTLEIKTIPMEKLLESVNRSGLRGLLMYLNNIKNLDFVFQRSQAIECRDH